MELNSRTMSILQGMADSSGEMSVKQICDLNDINRRTFYYDLEKANDLLAGNGIETIKLNNGRCSISRDSRKAIRELLSNRDIGYYKTARERRIIISFYIGLSRKRVNISDFIDMFDVSKNTIFADLQKIKEEVGKKEIEISYDSHEGYRFTGGESEIRAYLICQFRQVKNSRTKDEIKSFINRCLGEDGTEQDYWDGFRSCLLIYEELMGADIVETDIENCVFMLSISFIRSFLGHIYRTGNNDLKIRDSATYESVRIMMQRIEERMELSAYASEVTYIVLRLAGMQNFRINEDKIEAEAVDFTERYVSNIEEVGNISFANRDDLIRQMANHITPMSYRIGYSMQIENPLTNNIKQTYAKEFELAREALAKTDPELAQRITDDELSYLAVFIASGATNKRMHGWSNKILIICAEGVATALMLEGQLRELLGDFFEYEITSIKRSSKYNFEEYLMVITTLDTAELRDRAMHVNVLLTEDNEQAIIDYLSRTELSSTFAPYDIVKLVETDIECDENSLNNLTKDLLRYLNDHRYDNRK